MSQYEAILYAYIDNQSNQISYILLSRKIEHIFVLDVNISLVFATKNKKAELIGYDTIIEYLKKYRYIFDFPEVEKWN